MLRSIDYWYALASGAIAPEAVEQDLLAAIEEEVPNMISTTMERTCNLQCLHCSYPPETSTAKNHDRFELGTIINNLVKQLPTESEGPHFITPSLLHDGRILRPWHLQVLRQARALRDDLTIGLIDNGTFTRLLPSWGDFRLDWLDISIDGLETAHNTQRDNKNAFAMAINGFRQAREVVRPAAEGGRISALFTLTTLNYADLYALADRLFTDGLINEFHSTLMSPARTPNYPIEISVTEFAATWSDIVAARQAFGEQFFFRIYRIEDLFKFATIIGRDEFTRAWQEAVVVPARASIVLTVADVEVHYFPLSIWPSETFLVDADGIYRTAYSSKYTLAELRRGQSFSGENTSRYSVAALDGNSSLCQLYRKCVQQWWLFLGQKNLVKELSIVNQLLQGGTN